MDCRCSEEEIPYAFLEPYLIAHCSPTLARLKTASLFHLHGCSANLSEQIGAWNDRLSAKGITLHILRRQENAALIYVCRMASLQTDLQKPGVMPFLSGYGYGDLEAAAALEQLRIRLRESSGFPHEIGIFLGYPLEDVRGFIEHAGQRCKCVGCWKVYGDECEAMKLFAKFKKCRDVYTRLWQQGRSVWQLAVAA